MRSAWFLICSSLWANWTLHLIVRLYRLSGADLMCRTRVSTRWKGFCCNLYRQTWLIQVRKLLILVHLQAYGSLNAQKSHHKHQRIDIYSGLSSDYLITSFVNNLWLKHNWILKLPLLVNMITSLIIELFWRFLIIKIC